MEPQNGRMFSEYIRNKLKTERKRRDIFTNNNHDDHSNQVIYNGCLTRSKLIESRLNEIIAEYSLPSLEEVVEHIRNRRQYQSDDENDDNDGVIMNGEDGVSIRSVKRYSGEETGVGSNTGEFLLRQLLSTISQFIQLMDDRSPNQHIIEKAAVYLLWVFYDAINYGGNVKIPVGELNMPRFRCHYTSVEYAFCMELSVHFELIQRLSSLCRSLFDLMDLRYLSQIFHYPSRLISIVQNLEQQTTSTADDWFRTLMQENFPNLRGDSIDPFETADPAIPVSLTTQQDRQIIEEVSEDFSKFFNILDQQNVNCDLILQNILDNNGGSQKTTSSETSINSNAVNNGRPSEVESHHNKMENSCSNSTEDVMALLYNDLAEFILEYNSKHGEMFFFSNEELYNTILNCIINGNDDGDLFQELTNWLGEDSLELIAKIVTSYKPKMKQSNVSHGGGRPPTQQQQTQIIQRQIRLERADQIWKKINQAKDTGSMAVRPSVTIQTSQEVALKKEMRKIEKKLNKEMKRSAGEQLEQQPEAGSRLTLYDLQRMKEENLRASIRTVFQQQQERQLQQYRPVEKYPFVYDMYQTVKTTASYIAETKLLLPVGCERKEHKTHDQIHIPIMADSEETKKFLENFTRIRIEDTDDFVRTAFRGFETLNIIQSAVFQTAYQSHNQNMLICAPTGAGKTNIAMLTILNVLRTHCTDENDPQTIDLDQFKIIYIAPMKALCAEMTATFGKRLQPFGVKVRELTGDMQMTSKEIMETQMLVVTPEKWDVVTRKSVGDVQLMDLVRLIIIDEVHLLQSERGHVLETLVARTVRYVEQAQKYIRLVGLSATLPSYVDVARFLHVDLYKGLYVFDERFRPVPLAKTFIGCKATTKNQMNADMDELTFTRAKEILRKEYQVMVFVHSRNSTMNLATFLLERSQYTPPGEESLRDIFVADTARLHGSDKLIAKARYRNLNRFLLNGIGIHHAGMPRSERNIVEKLFKEGVIKILVCTSTLAWGVNLPAHSVIIRGTEYYDPAQGHYVDIDMLDVMQIFGRAGRPQFDTDGDATIITNYDKLPFYLNMLTNQLPIESRFLKRLTDNLNAEIVLGTVSNISEVVEWLRYTYAYIRMQKNPTEYGLKQIAATEPAMINDHLYSLARSSAEQLDRAQMVRYNPDGEGILDATHLGRIASHFYVQHETIVHLNENIKENMDIGNILAVLSQASEFQQLRCREEEIGHLDMLKHSCCYFPKGDLTNTHTKVNVLMQSAISRATTECHSLNSDLMYILQNVSRLTRGLFEYVLRRGWPSLAEKFLNVSLMFEKRIWCFDTPLWQFESELTADILQKLSDMHIKRNLHHYDLKEMSVAEIGEFIRNKKYAPVVKKLAETIPTVVIEASVKPITRTILTVYIDVAPDFVWDDKYHGKAAQVYWIWLTDMNHNHIYHAELGRFTKKQVVRRESQRYVFTIPLLDAEYLQQQYLIHCTFEYWLGSENETAVSCHNVILPDKHLPHTPLLDLMPLPISALQNPDFESIYPYRHFNPIQTQIFHTLYHTDHNVLLGAPTGSGKTVAAEIALFRVVQTQPGAKIVYIAPLKALVRERVDDWRRKIEQKIGLRVVELTGDVTPDLETIDSAQIIVTTPEKWDGVSRGWTFRKFVQRVALVIIDEIHLLGEERGPVLEMIVSRANFICRRTGEKIRIVGLSTAVANAHDLAAWLGIQKAGLYNFSPSVRPVPIEVHVSGFSGKHYCPRMASMNKPAYRAIKKHSPTKPVIVFVSSRRQTRLTALDLITLVASDDRSTGVSFLHMDNQEELEVLLEGVKDNYLRHTLMFGIGMHHAGLGESDRKLVEQLFSEQKIQVLITTATLAWGINLPAHAVIIKGTEYFDGKKSRYVDFPITDVLQMIGRAGRPQFDTSAVAILFVHDIKKEYYKKFLYEPFPVESHLLDVFPDHLNAEIISGTVKTKHEAMEYLSSTYLYHRIIKNPSYYGVDLSEVDPSDELMVNTQVIRFLSAYIDSCVDILVQHYCVRVVEEEQKEDKEPGDDRSNVQQILVATPLGKIASYYYLSHKTISMFQDKMSPEAGDADHLPGPIKFVNYKTSEVLDLLTRAVEYAPLPVRHNEELLNQQLAEKCPIQLDRRTMDSPHTKANLLIQAHCSRIRLPIVDYYTDLKTVMDQVLRIIQAMIDICAINGSLPTTIKIIELQQSIIQASWQDGNQLIALLETNAHQNVSDPFGDEEDSANTGSVMDAAVADLEHLPSDMFSVPALLHFIQESGPNSERRFRELLSQHSIHPRIIKSLYKALLNLPLIQFERITIRKNATSFDDNSTTKGTLTEVPLDAVFQSLQNLQWLSLEPNADYLITCRMKKTNAGGGKKAYCPNFPKPKSESWYVVLGRHDQSELVSITRVPYIQRHGTVINLQFRTPGAGSRTLYAVYLMSDSYIGLDQQYLLAIQS